SFGVGAEKSLLWFQTQPQFRFGVWQHNKETAASASDWHAKFRRIIRQAKRHNLPIGDDGAIPVHPCARIPPLLGICAEIREKLKANFTVAARGNGRVFRQKLSDRIANQINWMWFDGELRSDFDPCRAGRVASVGTELNSLHSHIQVLDL